MTTQKERVVFIHGRDRDYTADEYFELNDQMEAAKERGDMAEYDRLSKIIPMSPNVMKAFKEVYGKEFIVSRGFDVTEANLEFGEGWLDT